jgi:hypothetical protein
MNPRRKQTRSKINRFDHTEAEKIVLPPLGERAFIVTCQQGSAKSATIQQALRKCQRYGNGHARAEYHAILVHQSARRDQLGRINQTKGYMPLPIGRIA